METDDHPTRLLIFHQDLPKRIFKAPRAGTCVELGGEGIRKYDLIRWNAGWQPCRNQLVNLLKMSTNTVMTNPTYMAGYPPYCLTTVLPTFMYYTITPRRIIIIWEGSGSILLYKTAREQHLSGTTKGELGTCRDQHGSAGPVCNRLYGR